MRGFETGNAAFPASLLPRLGTICVLALLTGLAQAQSVDADLDRTSILLGDRVSLTVTVLHTPDGRILWPEPEEGRFGPFEVLDEQLLDPAREEGRIVSRKRWILTAFEMGELTLPALKVQWIPAGRDDGEAFETPPLTLTVEELGADPQGDLRQIKPPQSIPLSPWTVALWAALILAACVLAWWLYRRYKRRPKSEPVRRPPPAEPALPAHEIAYRELARLEASSLLQDGQVKDFYVQASDIIRRYLQGRYGIEALEMTSRDIMLELRRQRVAQQNQRLMELLSQRCDLVKFAKLRPDAETNSKIVPLARQIVDGTKPEPPASPAVHGPSGRDAAALGRPPRPHQDSADRRAGSQGMRPTSEGIRPEAGGRPTLGARPESAGPESAGPGSADEHSGAGGGRPEDGPSAGAAEPAESASKEVEP